MKKKQIILYICIGVICLLIGMFIGDASAISRVNKQMDANLNQTNTNKQSSKESKTTENQIKTIPLNNEESFGNVGIKVLNVKETNKISNEAGSSTPSGKFIVIELSLENKDKQPIQYNTNQFNLVNNDTIYKIDDVAFEASEHLNQQETIYNKNKDYIGVFTDFNSGITKKTYLVFDVPKDVNLDTTKLIVDNDKNTQFSLK